MRTPSLFVCLFVYVTVFQPRLWPFRLRIFCIPRSHNGNWHTHKNAYPEMNEKVKYLSNSFNKQIIRNSRERDICILTRQVSDEILPELESEDLNSSSLGQVLVVRFEPMVNLA